MPYILLGILGLVGLLALGRIFVTTPVATLMQVFKWMSVGLVSAAGVYFVASGRLGWALVAAPAVLPFLTRAFRAAKMRRAYTGSGGGAGPMGLGQTSEVRTRFLRMVLDHDSGEMNGDVLEGTFAGRTLRNLSLGDLLALLGDCRGDEESVQVLSAYLDRYHGDTWRDQAERQEQTAAPKASGMTRAEAFEILGLASDAGEADIKAAHHRLMSKIHPDHGGSTYLAAKINQAKDLLLTT